jgi:hypothetical protein
MLLYLHKLALLLKIHFKAPMYLLYKCKEEQIVLYDNLKKHARGSL